VTCDTLLEMRNVYSILVGKSEGERPLGRNGRRWEKSIKMERNEIGINFVRINPLRDIVQWLIFVNMVMNLRTSC
jgi:hypothetical protein